MEKRDLVTTDLRNNHIFIIPLTTPGNSDTTSVHSSAREEKEENITTDHNAGMVSLWKIMFYKIIITNCMAIAEFSII